MNELRGATKCLVHIDSLGFIEETKMNNEPWFNLDSESTRLHQEALKAEQEPTKAFPELDQDQDEQAPQQDAGSDDYEGYDAPKRYGNNRKHVAKSHAKIRRKLAKASKRRNRK